MASGKARNFLYQVAVTYNEDDCLLWPHKKKNGYGVIRAVGARGKWQLVHRIVCHEVHGAPPSDLHQAAHSCGNGHLGCVNPKHLRWATHLENMADKKAHGTNRNGQTKLTELQVREILSLKGLYAHSVIAKRYAVSTSLISMILTGRAWRHLQGDANG